VTRHLDPHVKQLHSDTFAAFGLSRFSTTASTLFFSPHSGHVWCAAAFLFFSFLTTVAMPQAMNMFLEAVWGLCGEGWVRRTALGVALGVRELGALRLDQLPMLDVVAAGLVVEQVWLVSRRLFKCCY